MFCYPVFEKTEGECPDKRQTRNQLRKFILDLHEQCAKSDFQKQEVYNGDKYIHNVLVPVYDEVFREEVGKIQGGKITLEWTPFSGWFEVLVLEFEPDKIA